MATDFGQDTLCVDSLLTGRTAKGIRVLAQRCYHRLITPRGTLRGGRLEASFGRDISAYLGKKNDKTIEASMPSIIKKELRQEEQIRSVDVSVESTKASDGSVSWTIDIEAKSDVGPFRLVLAVDDVSVEILELEAA